jgi:hypothetical protein
MRKILAGLAAILLSIDVFAIDYVVDGGFDNGFVGQQQYLNGISADIGGDGSCIGDGWINDDNGGYTWAVNEAGQAERQTAGAWSWMGFGQIVAADLEAGSELTFSFDYTNAASGTFEAAVWGVQGNGTDTWVSWGGDSLDIRAPADDGLVVNGGPEPAGNYLFVEELSDKAISGAGTYSATITLSSNCNYLVIAFAQDKNSDPGTAVDNVQLTAAGAQPAALENVENLVTDASSDGLAVIGETNTVQVVIANTGDLTASNVQVVVTQSSNPSYFTITNNSSVADLAGGSQTTNVVSVVPSESAVPGTYTFDVALSADGGITAFGSFDIIVASEESLLTNTANFITDESGDGISSPGETNTVRVVVANYGAVAASNVTVSVSAGINASLFSITTNTSPADIPAWSVQTNEFMITSSIDAPLGTYPFSVSINADGGFSTNSSFNVSLLSAESLIVNGGFGAGFAATKDYLWPAAGDVGGDGDIVGDGWVLGFADRWTIGDDGKVRRTTLSTYSYVGFGQIIQTNLAAGTELMFSFDYSVDADPSAFQAAVWGLAGTNDFIKFGDSLQLNSQDEGIVLYGDSEGAGTNGNYTTTAEFNDINLAISGSGTYTTTITLSTNCNYLMVGFSSKNTTVSDDLTIDNVQLVITASATNYSPAVSMSIHAPNAVFSWQGDASENYILQGRTNLVYGDWSNVLENISGVDGPMAVTNGTSADQEFYRIIVQ